MIGRFTFFVSLLLFIFQVNVFACSCARTGPAPCGGINKTEIIFVGTVTDIENPVTEKREDQAGVSRYRFRVDEVLSGLGKAEVDVYSGRGGGDCSYHFKAGQQYLVFPYANHGQFWAGHCTETRPAADAQAFLPQLRAMRDNKKVASLYGQLYVLQQPSSTTDTQNNYRPIGNAKVQLRVKNKRFESGTDAQGTYAFYDLPAGSYRIGATLPPNLVLDQASVTVDNGPLKLPAGACYENDLEALPTGRIRGQVLDPDGQRLECAPVELFIASEYDKGGVGLWGIQCEKDHFEFESVSPGDYILVFNDRNQIEPKTPFTRSYFPGTPDLGRARVIHLNDGEQMLDANIHVAAARALREVTAKFIAEQGRLPIMNIVETKSQDDSHPGSQQIAPGVLKLFLFKNENYELQGRGSCSMNGWETKTNPREVSGSDQSVTEVTLIYPGKPCGN
jgi:hypothetical protein